MLNTADRLGLDGFLARQSADGALPTLSEGTFVGSWEVVGFLGRGCTSEVYRVKRNGETAAMPQFAALKLLTKLDDSARHRFTDEIRILTDNTLPQFSRYYANGEKGVHLYAVMELLEPYEVPTSEKGIAAYLLAVCEAVAALHRSGCVHRDLKPKNIMRRTNGEVVLIDFGLAKDMAHSALPRTGVSIADGKPVGVGTPGYAAPEQWLGGEVSPVADIHALGRMANAAFNGKPPRNWVAIIRRATSSIPEQRYGTIEEFAVAIRRRNWLTRLAMGSVGVMVLMPIVGMALWNGTLSPLVRERRAWDDLCVEATVTNLVRQKLVRVLYADMNNMTISTERRYRIVTNRANVVRIMLPKGTNAFVHPVTLSGNREYWVTGPGLLEGTFRAAGTNVVMRLEKCIVRNHAPGPMRDTGVFYDLQDGAGLEFPDLEEPEDHGRDYIERNGSPTKVTFKMPDRQPASSR